MMRLHQVHIWVAPGLWRGITWPTTPAIAQIETAMVRVPSMVIPAQEPRREFKEEQNQATKNEATKCTHAGTDRLTSLSSSV